MKINLLFISSVFIVLLNQYVLPRLVKTGSFPDIHENSGNLKYSLITGLVLIIILIPASIITFIINQYLLLPHNMGGLRIIFLIIIAGFLGFFVKTIIISIIPAVSESFKTLLSSSIISGAELSLVIGILNIEAGFISDISVTESLIQAFAAGFAFTIVLSLLTGIIDRVDFSEVHPKIKGIPVTLLAACLLALAFFGLPVIRILIKSGFSNQ
jgi:Na+-translocating ferredoxin:NAD+ oxidoreductase subunit A